jgi:integrase
MARKEMSSPTRLNAGQVPLRARRLTVREVQADWFAHLDELEAAGELRPRTVASRKDGVRLHSTPTFGSRQLASVTPDDFVDWHEKQRRSGAAAWSVRARWMGIRGLFGYAARTGLIVTNPCDLLVRRERPKPGKAKQRYLTTEEMKTLLQRASGEGSIVVPLADYTLRLTFDDSSERVVDLADELWGAMGEPLRDSAYFRQVHVDPELRTIVWPNGFDLDPDVLHGHRSHDLAPAATRQSAA